MNLITEVIMEMSLNKVDVVMGALLFLFALIVYLNFLAPSVLTGDSADFTIASYVLGIPHPNGYPVYTWLGHIFTFLPVGDIAYRVNLMSAFFGALAIPLIYLIIRLLMSKTKDKFSERISSLSAIIASISFIFSVSFWTKAEMAEVYTLNAFFLASMILLLLIWTEDRNPKLLYIFSLLFGLSLGAHMSNILFILPFLALIYVTDNKILSHKKTLALMTSFFMMGVLQFAYVLIRAWQNPQWSYAYTGTINSWLYFISSREYSNQAFAYSLSQMPERISMYMGLLVNNFSIVGILIALVGVVLYTKMNLLRSAFLISLYLMNVWFFIQYNAFDVADMLIPSFLIFAIFLGIGIWEIANLINDTNIFSTLTSGRSVHILKLSLIILVVMASLTIPILSYSLHSQEIDKLGLLGPSSFVSEIMKEVPQNSTIITYWWPGLPFRYFQIVYHLNPNLEMLITSPANWPNSIAERIGEREVFLLDLDEAVLQKYTPLPVLTMPNVGVLYRVRSEMPSFSSNNSTISNRADKLFGENLRLIGYNLDTTEMRTRNKFSITYYWLSLENTSKNYVVYLDIVDQNDNTILEDVHAPLYNIYPTSQWPKGEILAENYNIILPPDIPSGTYRVVMKSGGYIDPSDPSSLIPESLLPNELILGEIEFVGKRE